MEQSECIAELTPDSYDYEEWCEWCIKNYL